MPVARPGRPVELVRVRHASSIPEPALQQAFRMLTEGSSMADAALGPSRSTSSSGACGFAGALGHDDLIGGSVAVCPACGDVSTVRGPPSSSFSRCGPSLEAPSGRRQSRTYVAGSTERFKKAVLSR